MGCGCAGVMPPPQYGGSPKKRSTSKAAKVDSAKQKAGSSNKSTKSTKSTKSAKRTTKQNKS